MEYEQLKTFVNNEIEPYLLNAEMWQCITALGIKPVKDGNQWSFLYGENIQEGICGFGDTIDEAALNFYTNLKSEKISQNEQNHSDKIETKFHADEKIRNYILTHFKRHLKTCAEFASCGIFSLPFTGEEIKMMETSVAWLEKQGKQKPAGWSEKLIADVFEKVGLAKIVRDQENDAFTEALQSAMIELAKYSVVPQPKQEWSEEDSKNMKECVIAISMSEGHTLEEKEQLEDWLKYHLSQKQCGYNPYKEVVGSIAEMCEKYKLPTSNLSDFLDNVKVKCKEAKEYDAMFPQNTWKPTEKHIQYLQAVVNDANNAAAESCHHALKDLLEQLKELKG